MRPGRDSPWRFTTKETSTFEASRHETTARTSRGPTRDAIHETTEPLRFDNADRVDFSSRAQLLASESEASTSEKDSARAERIEELRVAFEAGTLNSDERVDQAAQKMLAGNAGASSTES